MENNNTRPLDPQCNYRIFNPLQFKAQLPHDHKADPEKCIAEEIPLEQAFFTNPMFVIVPKKGGKWRPEIKLKELNKYFASTISRWRISEV